MPGVEEILLNKHIAHQLNMPVASRLNNVGEYYFSKKMK
jgi:hypothetical protein